MPSHRRTWAIGDIHGDLDGLDRVLLNMQKDGLNYDQDLIVFLGDMIDGYPYSAQVVSTIRAFQQGYPENVIVIRGNHEQLLIDAIEVPMYRPEFQVWWQQGGAATFESYQPQPWDGGHYTGFQYLQAPPQMQDDIEWFKSLPLFYETDQYIFVHAGLRPPLPPQATSDEDLLWIREDFIDSNYDWGKVVVFGHTAMEAPLIQTNKIGLDTRWRGKGYVSGADLTNGVRLYRG